MVTAKDLRNFLKDVPDHAWVIFGEGNITFLFNDNTLAINKYGATWDNGVGYPPGGTSCCGECSHFDCARCREEITND